MQTVYENLYYELQLTRSAKRDRAMAGDVIEMPEFQLTRNVQRDGMQYLYCYNIIFSCKSREIALRGIIQRGHYRLRPLCTQFIGFENSHKSCALDLRAQFRKMSSAAVSHPGGGKPGSAARNRRRFRVLVSRGGGAFFFMEFAEALEAKLRGDFFQMFRYVELLRTFGQTFSAVHAGGGGSSALYR